MTPFEVELAKCRFTTQAISVDHIFPGPNTVCERGPLVVSLLNDGNYFVHNGRHRVIRGLLEGRRTHPAVWLDEVTDERVRFSV